MPTSLPAFRRTGALSVSWMRFPTPVFLGILLVLLVLWADMLDPDPPAQKAKL